MTPQDVRDAYVPEHPAFVRLARNVKNRLDRAARQAGLQHLELTHRAKDVRSFVRKAIAKGYDNPMVQITDKAGVRAVIAYRQEETAVERLVEANFKIVDRVDKRSELLDDRVGYMGLHLVVAPKRGGKADRLCEIQIRTRAEDVWARLSHEMLYKAVGGLKGSDRRRAFRLSALSEVFDQEADTTWTHLIEGAGYVPAKVTDAVEKQFFTLTGLVTGDDLTTRVIQRVLLPCYSSGELKRIDALIAGFVDSNIGKLREIYAHYEHDDRHFFLSRPESLLIFDQLERDPFRLASRWSREVAFSELRAIAEVWGKEVVEPV